MPKFRKKPIVIEAVEYAGNGNLHSRYNGQIPNWMWTALEAGTLHSSNGNDPLIVETLEGPLTISPNDWIIKGITGELYPCKPDIFQATYEEVES